MSNVYPFPNKTSANNEQVMQTACDWIAKIDRQLNEQESADLKTWLAESKAHYQTFIEVAKMWDKMDDLSRLSSLFPQTEYKTPMRSNKPSHYWLTAASVCFAAILGWLLVFSPMQSNNDYILAFSQHYQTRVGQNNTIALPDGSKLTLNTNTFVQVRYSQYGRIIDLQRGEIHIEVAHDKERPLSVLAGGKVIQAVGTAFSVQMDVEKVELIVTDGKVVVAPKPEKADDKTLKQLPKKSLAVAKGQKVELDPSNKAVEKVVAIEPIEIASNLSWRSGNLIFRGESLEQAMAEISRYTETKFIINGNDQLKQTKVAGVFKTGDVNGLLSVLESNFAIQYQKQADGSIVLSPAS